MGEKPSFDAEGFADSVEECQAYLRRICEATSDGATEITLKDILERLELLQDQNSIVLRTLGEPSDLAWDGKRTDASVISLLKAIVKAA